MTKTVRRTYLIEEKVENKLNSESKKQNRKKSAIVNIALKKELKIK